MFSSKKLHTWLVALALLFGSAPAFGQTQLPLLHVGGGSRFTPSCSQSTAFLARTSGLDATHKNAYDALICGLVTDSIYTKFDVLYVFATQDATTALLNLASTSFNGTANGSPAFVADRGYTGVDTSTTVYIDSGFDYTGGGSPQYTQNSAHMSVWSVTDVGTNTGAPLGGCDVSCISWQSTINIKFTDNNFYTRINSSTTFPGGTANATPTGHYIGNRSSSSAIQGYKNGSSILSVSNTSRQDGYPARFLGLSKGPTSFGAPYQLAMGSYGASLSSTDATNFYNRLRTYMTAVGVP